MLQLLPLLVSCFKELRRLDKLVSVVVDNVVVDIDCTVVDVADAIIVVGNMRVESVYFVVENFLKML